MAGQLFVFEGPDGVGKTTLSQQTVQWLNSIGLKSRYVSFPGSKEGTLGKLVYDVHHSPEQFGCENLDPTARQLLHIAAHIDTLHKIIKPALAAGENLVLDRYWWSTVVYGKTTSAPEESIRLMIDLEKLHWADITPSIVFLLERAVPGRLEQPPTTYQRLRSAYSELAQNEKSRYQVLRVPTEGTPEDSFAEIVTILQQHVRRVTFESVNAVRQGNLPLGMTKQTPPPAPIVFSRLAPAVPTYVYDTYWRFAAKRQEVFFRRLRNEPPPWTDDPILLHFKFTNAYRASDRVSQYLIKEVIYKGPEEPEELFFRTLLFKLFNKIETWNLLKLALGRLTSRNFDLESFDRTLTAAMEHKQKIYSAAYIMPSGGKHGDPKKHRNHLKLLKSMLSDGVALKLTQVKRMRHAFEILRSYPMVGDFLAYQYVTDLNYSTLTNFSEMEFVIPGPGARDGIRKCFKDLGGLNEADIIKMVADRQETEFERLGIQFQSLWGRPLQLIDCQNLFCEVDKYARHAHPEITGITGRTRIKQMFRCAPAKIDFWYPPKWGLNEKITQGQELSHAHV